VLQEIADAKREAYEKKQNLDAWKRKQDKLEQAKGLHQDPHCLDSALGCLK
jgi:hypothetical protein